MNDIRPVIVRGSKISLGVLNESDTEFLFSAINNPEVHRFLRNPGRIMYIGDEINWFRSLSEKSANDRHFAIIENDGMKIVGVIGVREIDWINGTGIIGYFLSQDKWGKGFATAALFFNLIGFVSSSASAICLIYLFQTAAPEYLTCLYDLDT